MIKSENVKRTFTEKVDFFFNKLLPKKFICITLAAVMVFCKIDVPMEFWILLGSYCGLNVVAKQIKASVDKVEMDHEK